MESHSRPSSVGPVFIVGMNGSGTTMLADSLGRHPELYVFPVETRILPYYVQRQIKFGPLSEFGNRRVLALELGRQRAFWRTNGKSDVVLEDWELHEEGFAGVVDAMFMHFARSQGKSRWGEKSPVHLRHITLLSREFPHARFIHIIRDGRDAAQSFHRRYGYVPEETIHRWKVRLKEGRAQGKSLGSDRYLEVRYELITREPESIMRQICSFVDLPYDPVVTKSSMRMVDPNRALAIDGQIIENSGRWQTYFAPPRIYSLEAIAGATLQELGYDVSCAGDNNPHQFQLRWWALRGKAAITIRHFRRWGLTGLPGYLRSVGSSIRQQRSGRL